MQNVPPGLTIGLALTLSALSSGCVSSGPNTQRGAVNGAAIGALAGAIIGNNSGHRTLEGAAIGATAGAIAGGTIGNSVDHQQGTLYTSPQEAETNYVVSQPPHPPQLRYENVTVRRPSQTAVWINGYWLYDGQGYLWVEGHWEVPPPRYRVYNAPHWEQHRNGSYVYVRGYWH